MPSTETVYSTVILTNSSKLFLELAVQLKVLSIPHWADN